MRQMVGQIIKMRGALWVNAFLYYFSRLWMVGRLVPPTAYAGYRAKKALSAAAVAVRQIIDLCGKPLYLLTFLLLPVILLAGSRPQFAGQEFSLFLSMLFFLSCILGAFGDSHIFNVTREKVAFLKYLHADARSYIQASLALRYVPFFSYYLPFLLLAAWLFGAPLWQGAAAWVLLAAFRMMSEAFHLFVFDRTGRVLVRSTGYAWLVIAVGLAGAYVPPLLGLDWHMGLAAFLLHPASISAFAAAGALCLYYIAAGYTGYARKLPRSLDLNFLLSSMLKTASGSSFKEVEVREADAALSPEALAKLVKEEKRLLICDTTMRDAHQSLLATRVRTRDMMRAADGTAKVLAPCFSLEMWGGATFDTAYRFLYESPWERLRLLREKIPNIPFQMLLRGSNLVGYASYPDNVVRAFVAESARCGIDVFRVFDSLNWIPSMEVAMDEVLKQGKLLEATVCYTGDILDPTRDKYTLKYYVDFAKELERRGAHTICIKDMSGLLKPYAARELVKALKQEVGVPIHLHSHNTTDNQIAAYLMAAEAGVDIVDCAIAPLSSLTSQPSLNSLVEALRGQERDTGLDPRGLERLGDYWGDVRLRYKNFDNGLVSPLTEIYRYQIPGGQYTNLRPQVEALGLGARFDEVREMFRTVNDMLGDIVKVTPSSKMVGDLAIFMVQNDLTPENIVEKGKSLAFPDSVVSYFKGMMGQPTNGFPEDLQKVVLKGEEPITCRPGELLDPVDWDELEKKVKEFSPDASWRDVISYAMYPKVLEDFFAKRKEFGYLVRMGSHIFFNGMAVGETTKVNIEDGKTLVIKYLGLGDRNEDGTRTVQFELNGMRREIDVPDPQAADTGKKVVMADLNDKGQVGASIPGMVSKISVKKGETVKENQVLATIEAMKMETSVVARMDGTVEEVLIEPGRSVKAGELLFTIKA